MYIYLIKINTKKYYKILRKNSTLCLRLSDFSNFVQNILLYQLN